MLLNVSQPVLREALVLALEGVHVVQQPHPQLLQRYGLAPKNDINLD